MFLLADTQWRTAGMGGVIDLDYAGVRPVAEALGVAWTEDLVLQLRLLGAGAARALRREAGE